tara:strand:- start:1702 stop:2232 length:531 start_codon:yes stop_codon:yes gene_type:complete
MNSHYLNFRLLLFFIITSLFLISCSTKPQLIKNSELKDIQFQSNYTLEGKFKASINDIKETGYFVIKKIENSIELRIGKNYLLPEKIIYFLLDEKLNISDLFYENKINTEYQFSQKSFTLKNLLKSLLGKEQTLPLDWKVEYPDDISSVNGFKLPKKIIIKNNEMQLEIINKNYIE